MKFLIEVCVLVLKKLIEAMRGLMIDAEMRT
jgi:hypothetical protein